LGLLTVPIAALTACSNPPRESPLPTRAHAWSIVRVHYGGGLHPERFQELAVSANGILQYQVNGYEDVDRIRGYCIDEAQTGRIFTLADQVPTGRLEHDYENPLVVCGGVLTITLVRSNGSKWESACANCVHPDLRPLFETVNASVRPDDRIPDPEERYDRAYIRIVPYDPALPRGSGK
jgi:hypothetical protein